MYVEAKKGGLGRGYFKNYSPDKEKETRVTPTSPRNTTRRGGRGKVNNSPYFCVNERKKADLGQIQKPAGQSIKHSLLLSKNHLVGGERMTRFGERRENQSMVEKVGRKRGILLQLHQEWELRDEVTRRIATRSSTGGGGSWGS